MNKLPRYKGFNLLGLFVPNMSYGFFEDDFKWMEEWGFNFARIPMNYRNWYVEERPEIKEEVLEIIDKVVVWGQKYGIHICLNIHGAPGYCVNEKTKEGYNLWKDKEPLELFVSYWQTFAKRYKGISSKHLSFNLINEPRQYSKEEMTKEDFIRVMTYTIEKIREIDKERLIIIDGVNYGNEPVFELTSLGVAQSCRAYLPFELTHYKAEWVEGSDKFSEPSWPLVRDNGEVIDREYLRRHYEKWTKLFDYGVGVICGEGGAYKYTSHEVVLRWLSDVLDVLKELNIGIALWNLRGPFGIIDSGREDVEYEDFYGHKLDRKLLELLMRF
ncbi:glycoside hydrolase, family 5 [Caldicellulosiruptor saccharolyticus DSM 8903]|uniref:Glycoside hydrolase, family 5 n=1 Tax=Caldicellulosiruptor saccharolyticus (strain ATCC 43494 / DSM 8903 / Tp8T 6331) TaxID=351627 RepID=A4XFV4_CALS8|nr:cellulase family glycosylhydrolase [Caldicellulosiruptor saccharolyticus]ABP65789.1 glycoside hydrolase, family 5 [Caldicellulosiruptor saccharolyticus DSM 8903]